MTHRKRSARPLITLLPLATVGVLALLALGFGLRSCLRSFGSEAESGADVSDVTVATPRSVPEPSARAIQGRKSPLAQVLVQGAREPAWEPSPEVPRFQYAPAQTPQPAAAPVPDADVGARAPEMTEAGKKALERNKDFAERTRQALRQRQEHR